MFHWFFKLVDGCALTTILFVKKSLKNISIRDRSTLFNSFKGFQWNWEIFISQNLKTFTFFRGISHPPTSLTLISIKIKTTMLPIINSTKWSDDLYCIILKYVVMNNFQISKCLFLLKRKEKIDCPFEGQTFAGF